MDQNEAEQARRQRGAEQARGRREVANDGEVIYHLQQVRHNADDIANAIDIFTGDDRYTVRAFIANVEAAAEQFGWTDLQTFVNAKRFISGTAKSLLRAVQVQSWAIHKMLASRRKNVGETAQQYSIAMREIAAMGPVDEADLIGYIVNGIARDKSERLFFASAVDMNGLRGLLIRYNEIVASDPVPCPQVEKRNAFASAPTTSAQVQSMPTRLRCYNCQDVGHFASACPKPRRPPTCFSCGMNGHMQSQCTRRNFQRQVANVDVNPDWRAALADAYSQGQRDTLTEVEARRVAETGTY